MGRIEKDVFGDGFTVYNDDGSQEHFDKNIFDDGYSGNKGTHIDSHIFNDGFIVTNKDGLEEKFERNIFDDNYSSNKGTKTNKDVFGSGASIYKNTGTSSGAYYSSGGSSGDSFSGNFFALAAVVFGIPALIFIYIFCLGVAGIIANLILFAVPLAVFLVNKKIDIKKHQMINSWGAVSVSITFLFAIVSSIHLYDDFGFLAWVGFAVSGLFMIVLQGKLSGEEFSVSWWLQWASLFLSWLLSMAIEYSIDYNRALPSYIYITIALPIIIQIIVAIVHTVRLISMQSRSKANSNSAEISPEFLKFLERRMTDTFDRQEIVTNLKVGINDACPCGSGKKYKKCCMSQT